jgi:hypothetical protein
MMGELYWDELDREAFRVLGKVITIILIIGVIILTPFTLYHISFTTGKGEQIGYISEVSNSGIL